MTWISVKELLCKIQPQKSVCLKGWVRTKRESRGFSFLEVNDGSCLKNIQVIVDASVPSYCELEKVSTGVSVCITGNLVESPGSGQKFEIQASEFEIYGMADPTSFPLQKKRHSNEYLRTIAHLRPRTNLFGSVFRVRSELSRAIHNFFHDRGFYYVHSPIITTSDCEGAGQMFRVSTLDPNNPPQKDKKVDFEKDFFGKEAFLTVSGQLEGEILACSLGKIYTFGPTFRAENSNTARHVSEIWMVEPEMAFYDLNMNMDLAEEFIKHIISHVLGNCSEDMELFFKFVDKELEGSLNAVLNKDFVRLPYEEAIEILEKVNKKFDFPVKFGSDLQSEHERFLAEKHFKGPVIVYNYSKDIKPFYMRVNDDERTVTGMDVIVPRLGEIIGGSQREERYDVLLRRIKELGLSEKDYWWYLDLRRFGSVPHSGFGLGFDRAMMFITGIQNIRDVILFLRTPGNAEF